MPRFAAYNIKPVKKQVSHSFIKGVKMITAKQVRKKRIKDEKKRIKKHFVFPKAAFRRCVKQISSQKFPIKRKNKEGVTTFIVPKFGEAAVLVLQEVTEVYLTKLLQESYLLTKHRNAITLDKQDMDLARLLRKEINVPPPNGWKTQNNPTAGSGWYRGLEL